MPSSTGPSFTFLSAALCAGLPAQLARNVTITKLAHNLVGQLWACGKFDCLAVCVRFAIFTCFAVFTRFAVFISEEIIIGLRFLSFV